MNNMEVKRFIPLPHQSLSLRELWTGSQGRNMVAETGTGAMEGALFTGLFSWLGQPDFLYHPGP